MSINKIAFVINVLSIIAFQYCAPAATLPSGFSERLSASGLFSPTAMEFAPDGRLFVCEQRGTLRVIKNDSLLSLPFVGLTVDNSGERGLLGIAFDPNFLSNHFLYLYYTATSPTTHNRVSRFTANGDAAVPGSEVILLDLPTLGATNHNGGAMHFGIDGKLYISVGENAVPTNSQSMSTLLGKMLRMNADGTIPTDNPFYATAAGQNRLIWVLGVRNPFTFDFRPGTQTMFINDVGNSTWEEIDFGAGGSNYGWPVTEGISTNPAYVNPMFEYGHSGSVDLTGCAITGGAFYNPATAQFPGNYLNQYFFADYCSGWIRTFHPSDSTATGFVTGISSPVDLKVSQDGSLYYLARGGGSNTGLVSKIVYSANLAPLITLEPIDLLVSQGSSAIFSVSASGGTPLSYQWQRNGSNISVAVSSTYSIASSQPADNGAAFRCIVSNTIGQDTSRGAILTVTPDQHPVAMIAQPLQGSLYSAGDTVYYNGVGTDPEQGNLPGSAFTWMVDFQHNTHHHPFIPPTTGSTSGSFVIPTLGETSDTVWYRIYLTVIDSQGLSGTDTAEIFPRKSTVTVATNPPGLQILIDGTPKISPYSFVGVVGMQRALEAVTPQSKSGQSFYFSSWSDGGLPAHSISTPPANVTYTAAYTQDLAAPTVSLTSPANAAVVTGPVTVSANAGDNISVAGVQFKLDGIALGAEDTSPPYTVVWNTLLTPNGNHTLTASARDAGGNAAGSAPVTVTVANAASSSDLWVYQDGALKLPWTNKSSGATVLVLNSTEQIYQGTSSIKVTQGHWGASSYMNGDWGTSHTIDASTYQSIDFLIYAPAPLVNLSVGLSGIGTVYHLGPEPANQWITVSVPMAGMVTTTPLFNQFYINDLNDNNSTVFYLDNIRMVSKVQQLLPPPAPVLVSPVNNATNQPVTVNVTWSPSAGALTYCIQLSDSATFGSLLVNDSTVAATSRSVTGLARSKTYYWRVNAKNAQGTSSYSAAYHFATTDSLPPAPILALPLNSAINQPVALTLSWSASSGAVTYRVQLSDSATFGSLIVNDSTIAATSRPVSGLTNSKSYFWRVNANNAVGTSAWSLVNSFITAPLPDTSAPVVAITLPTAGNVITGTVTLSANATDNVGITRVDFYLGTTLVGTDNSSPYSVSWNSSTVQNATYAFSARGYDPAGNVGFSGSVSATVSNSTTFLSIYQDGGLNMPWTNKSSGGTALVFNSTAQIFQGTSSMKVTQGHWGATSFMNGDWGTAQSIDANTYQSIDFAIYATTPLVNLSVGLNGIGTVYRVGPEPANQWITVSVPMTGMYSTASLFNQFYIDDQNDNSSTIYYLDNVRMVKRGAVQSPGTVHDPTVSEVGQIAGVPDHYELSQNYPNPFNPTTSMRVSLPYPSRVTLTLFNSLGARVSTLIDNQSMDQGTYTVRFNASTLASGVYFYMISASAGEGAAEDASGFTSVKRMLYIK